MLTPIEISTSYREYEEETRFIDEMADEIDNLVSDRFSAIEEWAIFDEDGSLKNVKCDCSEFFLDSIEKDLSAITLIAELTIFSEKEIDGLSSIISSDLERFCVDSLDSFTYGYECAYAEIDEYDVTVRFKESEVTVNEN